MAATFYTLATGGTEKSLQDWGVTLDFSISWQSKAKGTATLRTVENFDPAATQWLFKQHAVIYRDRTAANQHGPFAGGKIIFQGYFDDPQMDATPNSQNIVYRLHSVWWLFERNPFKQYTMQFTGFSKTNQRVVGVSVNAGGNGYTVNDVLTVVGAAVSQATYQVVAVDKAKNDAVVLVAATNGGGNYVNPPVSPANVTGGTGGGCKLALVFGAAPNLVPKVTSEIFLGEDLHQADGFTSLWPNGNGDQIGEVIDWMNETYNPTKRGSQVNRDDTKDVVQKGDLDPHTHMPVTRVNTFFCSEAILNVMRWDPDTVIVEDMTTPIPTLHFKKLARWNYAAIPPAFLDFLNLPEVIVNITKQQERRLLLQGALSRQVPGVIIYYKAVDQVDNSVVPVQVPDMFPNNGSVTDWTPEVSSHVVELLGSKLTHFKALVTVNMIAPFSLLAQGTAEQQAQWWLGHDKSLLDPAINAATIKVLGGAIVTDDNGNAIDTSVFVNELTSPLPSWTNQVSIRARVSQGIAFVRKMAAGSQVTETDQKGRVHSKTIVLTTAGPGVYSAVASEATAEIVPQQVAESVYRSLSAQQYSGTFELVGNPMPLPKAIAGPTIYPNWIGTRLTAVGPNHTFSNLLVQSVEMQPAYGRVSVTFGPGPAVDIDLWIELARASRPRLTWDLPSNRGDGGTNPSGSSVNVDTGAASPSDDTSHGVGGIGRQVFGGSAI